VNLFKDILQISDKQDKRKIFFLFLLILTSGITEVLGIASVAPFIGLISSPELIYENIYLSSIYDLLGMSSAKEFILFSGFFSIIAILISNSIQLFSFIKITHFSQYHGSKLSNILFSKYLYSNYEFIIENNPSELVKNVVEEVKRVVGGVILESLLMISKFFILLFTFSLLIFVDIFNSFAIFLIFGGVYFFIFKALRKKIALIGNKIIEANSKAFKFSFEAIGGFKNVRLSQAEDFFIDRFSESTYAQARFNAIHATIGILPKYIMEFLSFGIIIIIIILMYSSGRETSYILPIISIFVMAGYRLLPAIQQIYVSLSNIRFNLPMFNIIFNELTEESHYENLSHSYENISLDEKIEFRDISFSYPNSNSKIFDSLTVEFPANKIIGIVGETGSGKTTLIDLISGLLPIQSGEFLVDEKKIRNSNLKSWRKKIGYVPQSIYLSDDTVLKNIAFGCPEKEINERLIQDAVKMAGLEKFTKNSALGLNTKVGDRGANLSGGQIQRIGIARALYKNPEIIIFDESTSALDQKTEEIIIRTIKKLSRFKTIFLIAHKESMINICDCVFDVKAKKFLRL